MTNQWAVKSAHGPRGATDWLERQQRDEAVRAGVARGLSDKEIARQTGLCDRTVLRIRHRMQLPNFYGHSTAGRKGT